MIFYYKVMWRLSAHLPMPTVEMTATSTLLSIVSQ